MSCFNWRERMSCYPWLKTEGGHPTRHPGRDLPTTPWLSPYPHPASQLSWAANPQVPPGLQNTVASLCKQLAPQKPPWDVEIPQACHQSGPKRSPGRPSLPAASAHVSLPIRPLSMGSAKVPISSALATMMGHRGIKKIKATNKNIKIGKIQEEEHHRLLMTR